MGIWSGIILWLAVGISIFSMGLNYNTMVRSSRKEFSLWLIATFFFVFVFSYSDFTRFAALDFLPPLPFRLPVVVLYVWWAAFAFPFYRTLSRRIFDAGLSKHLALLGLIPYLNFIFFLSLCFLPSKTKATMGIGP
jgi:uncharacterized membrane protein YhaH (DUF805 family)